ncbi:hypothetical protein Gotur_022987 [Gossypium turneri]
MEKSGSPGFLNRIPPLGAGSFVALFGQSREKGTREFMRRPTNMEKRLQFVKINFDAAYDGNLCQLAMGIVARDSEGNVLLSFIEIYHQVALAFAAEASAYRTATQIANSLAHTLATETLKKKDEIYLLGRVLEYAENLKEKEKTRELD